jgi:hypothetical protein
MNTSWFESNDMTVATPLYQIGDMLTDKAGDQGVVAGMRLNFDNPQLTWEYSLFYPTFGVMGKWAAETALSNQATQVIDVIDV